MANRTISVTIIGDADKLKKAFGEASRSASGFGSSMMHAGKIAAAGLGAGLAVVGYGLKKSVDAAAAFESTLNTLEAVSGATADQMRDVSKRARDLGRDITLPATSAKDAAEAMTELAKGGLSVKQSMKAAKGVLQLAAAAQIGNAEAATIAARALNAFGLKGQEAGRVADILANAANASTGEITDFAMGLQQSSAVAKQWGLSINETTAALMQLSDAGVVGSDAGTSLKTMLQSLSATGAKARGAMADLGVDVFDANGKFVGMETTINQFTQGLKGMSQEQQTAALKTIFGSDAVRAANIILGQGTDAFGKYVEKTERSGAAAELAAAKMKGFKGSMEAIKSAVETLQIELGTMLLPALTRAAEGVSRFVAKFAAAKGLKAKFEIVVEAAKDVGVAAAKIGQDIGGKIQVALGNVNWAAAANKIADQLGAALRAGIPKALDLSTAIMTGFLRAVQQVDWITVGSAIGKGIKDGAVQGAKNFVKDGGLQLMKQFAAGGPIQAVSSIYGKQVGASFVDNFGHKLKSDIPIQMENVQTLINKGIPPAQAVALAGGHRIGGGLAGGLTAALSGVGQSVANTIISQLNMTELQLKQKYGIHSPSTRWAKEIGEPLAQGIVVGVDGGLALLAPKMQAKIAAAVARAKAVVDSARLRMTASFSLLSDKLLRAFDAETGGTMSPFGQQLAGISDRRRSEDLASAVEDAQARLQDAMGSGDPAAIAAAQRDLFRAQEDIQAASLEKQDSVWMKSWADQRESMRENLEKQTALMAASFAARGATVKTALALIQNLMLRYGISFQEAGANIGSNFAAGLASAVGGAAAGAGGVRGSLTGGNAFPDSRPIVLQTYLDGKLLTESVQSHATAYQRSNGAWLAV
jgi:TP901 family phage tail tape measure protein